MGKGFKWGFGIALGIIAAIVLVILGFMVFTGVGIGLMASGPRIFGDVETARQKAAVAQLNLFETALGTYKLDMKRFPTTEEGLEALCKNPSSGLSQKEGAWDGPYLPRPIIPIDPWKNKYIYESHSDNIFKIISLGADGKKGGENENQDIVMEK